VSAPWYGNFVPVKEATNMTDGELGLFYSEAISNSFMGELNNQDEINAKHFNCYKPKNCTGSELAYKQWGNSAITLNPISTNNYMPLSYSMY